MRVEAENLSGNQNQNTKVLIFVLVAGTFLIYYFSNPEPQHYYDYTFRTAENFLRGRIGFAEKQPSWLNEFVPFGGNWYSVFPLGSVLSMIPFAFFKFIGIVENMPAALISALSASAVCLFLILISNHYEHDLRKKLLMILGVLFGSWMWTNLAMAGAWHLALGFSMVGELGAIYFTVFNRKPVLAGLFFALAFGNRTENLLTAPIFMYLLWRETVGGRPVAVGGWPEAEGRRQGAEFEKPKTKYQKPNTKYQKLNTKNRILTIAKFCIVPFILGVSTLVYNYARFHSPADFGYARIPGVLDEPWYNHGIFSIWYIPRQAFEMLFKQWEIRGAFPYLVPDAFSASILWSSPFILFALRTGARDKILKYAAWAAIFLLTVLLWMHGNSGGYQFGYRYAMVLLPWLFVILLENSPKKITTLESFAYGVSFLINLYATYLFFWTNYLKP